MKDLVFACLTISSRNSSGGTNHQCDLNLRMRHELKEPNKVKKMIGFTEGLHFF